MLAGIITIGDSWAWLIAANAPGSAPPAPGFNNSLGNVVDSFHPGAPVYNESFGGGTAAQHVSQLYSPGGIIDRVNAHPDADIVWLSSGGNDMLLGQLGGGFYVNNPGNAAVYAAIQSNVQTLVSAILAIRPDIQVVIEGYDYLNIWDTISGSQADAYRLNLGVIKTGNVFYDGFVQNAAVNQGFKDAESGKAAIANASRRVAHIDNYGLNNSVGGYSGYFGSFPASGVFPPDLYPALPTPANRMNNTDPIHLNNTGYATLALRAEQYFIGSALSAANLSLSTNTLNFGNVRVGTSAGGSATGSNIGGNYTKVKNLLFPAASGDFSGGAQSFNPLFQDPSLGSDTATVAYAYTPAARGADTANLTVTSDSGNRALALSGNGVGPVYSSSDSLSFGTALPGAILQQNLSIQNITTDGDLGALTNLTLASAAIIGPDAAYFSLPTFTPGTVLTAAQLQNLTVQFNGTDGERQYSAQLILVTDQDTAVGATGQQFSIALGAQVVSPALPVIDLLQVPGISEGDTLTLAALATDPSGVAGPLSFSWDVNGDSVYGDATGASPTLTWAQLGALGINDGPGTREVTVRVTNTYGGFTDSAAASLSIGNSAPQAGIAGPAVIVRGAPAPFVLSADDPSSADQAAPFTFAIDWDNNGTVDETLTNVTSGAVVTHALPNLGGNTVRVWATDQHGAQNAATITFTTVEWALLTDEINPSLVNLVWGGTTGSDVATFTQLAPDTVRVHAAQLNGAAVDLTFDASGVTGRVKGFGQAGNDQLSAAGLTTLAVMLNGGKGGDTLTGGDADDELHGDDGAEGGADLIFGGAGNDVLYGEDGAEGAADTLHGESGDDLIFGDGNAFVTDGAEGGNDIITGGDGHDRIFAGGGNDQVDGGADHDLLAGGDGAEGTDDTLIGGSGNDVLIASLGAIFGNDILDGELGEDLLMSEQLAVPRAQEQQVLEAVYSEWTSERDYATRIANLSGMGVGPRNNGDTFLTPGVNLLHDSLIDSVAGGLDLDWFLHGDNAELTDYDSQNEQKVTF
ncbi:MAG: PKD domain-containing protein [Pirellulales bacterium]|nr:PKD domain-containing protein [Pirellulales bacterium]